MVLGFALCTTMAFAQTAKSHQVAYRDFDEKHLVKGQTESNQPVDYKASIFTKTGDYDTARVFRFSESEWGTDITTGTIQATDHIWANGHDSVFGTANSNRVNVNAHSWCQWRRFADTNTFYNTVNTVYPNNGYQYNPATVAYYLGAEYNEGDAGYQDDGFVVLNYSEEVSGFVNIYMEFANVQRQNVGHMVWVHLNQVYAKYYDQCFIDYWFNNRWNAVEINVTGVDVEINAYASMKARYALPTEMLNEANIKIRIRACGPSRSVRFYGFGWNIDNVAIASATSDESWNFISTTPVEGFYGTIPMGMSLPVSYGALVRNTNITDINNATMTLKAGTPGNLANILTSRTFSLPGNDVYNNQKMFIDERGFIYGGDTNYTSWLGYSPNYGNNENHGNYGLRSLPTPAAGSYRYAIYADGGSQHTLVDSVLYTVSDELVYPNGDGVNGYRWARDNGLLPSNSAFKVAFTDVDDQGNKYITQTDEGNHSGAEGYSVHMSYVTGATVPTTDGQPWVLKGIEYVPATDGGNFAGEAVIAPIVRFETYTDDGQYLSWTSVATGIEGLAFDLTEDHLSNLPDTGYVMPTTGHIAPYSTVSIMFPNQPELRPNQGYRFGYTLNTDANFHVASQATSYKLNDSTTATYSYNDETAPYRRQNTPIRGYQVYVSDAAADDDITAWNINYYPMIRPIVGPREPVATDLFISDCSNNTEDSAFSVVTNSEELCGTEGVEYAVGGSYVFTVRGGTDHSVIDHIYVNGIEAQIYDPGDPEHNVVPDEPFYLSFYNTALNNDNVDTITQRVLANGTIVYDTTTILYRGFYVLRFPEIAETSTPYVITASFHYEDFMDIPTSGIDPVAPETSLSLYPNPATSTVKLYVNGVSGMVNCSIIDMSGRVVYNARVNAENENTINVSNMPAGAYFVRVTNDTFSKIEKLIIK